MGTESKPEPLKKLDPPLDGKERTEDPLDPAPTDPPPTPERVNTMIESARRNIHDSFDWLASESKDQLTNLGQQLAKKDEPPFVERLAAAALDVALLAGPAGAAEYLAGRLVGEAHSLLKEGGRELVKAFFEEGINAGIEYGREKLHADKSADMLSRFIDAQKAGLGRTGQQNQINWNNKGRLQIRTLDEVRALEQTCSPDNTRLAAEKQFEASRDAWVSYLAQTKYGEIEHQPAADGTGSRVTTNMTNQEQRERTNASAPGFVPMHAPDINDALFGRAPGVLSVLVELPEIAASTMKGEVTVKAAFLNGVNEDVRSQYEHKALGDLNIPRHVTARVRGDAPNFSFNLDEDGNVFGPAKAQSTWLRDRAVVEHPEHETLDGLQRQSIGTQMLIHETVVDDIKKGL
jgi:hypothetical protein